MSQRIIAIGIVIVAVILALFAFTQQQGAATNEATAVARAYSAATAQSQAEADQQTAIFQMDTHATAQSQAEATRAAADVSAQQAASTAAAAVDQAAHQADLASTAQSGATQQAAQAATAQSGATQQALQASTAQAGATQQAQIAAQAQADVTEQAITATAAQQEAIQLANTAEAFQADVTAQANQLATQESLASAVAATAQKAQTQIDQIAAHATTESSDIQATIAALETQAAIPASPQQVIQFLVQRNIIPENMGKLGSRLGRLTIDMSGVANTSHWDYVPGEYGDFVMSSDINWRAGSEFDTCDFIIRDADSNHYRIGINRSGQVLFDTYINGDWDESQPYADMSSLIHTKQSAANQLLVVGMGSTFTVFINGQMAITYRDTRLTQGQLGIGAATGQALGGSGCTFGNTWVWELSPAIPSATLVPTAQPTPFAVPSLDNQYTTSDGKLSLHFPSDWKASEVGSSNILYSKGIKKLSGVQIPSGEMTVIVSVISSDNGNQPDLNLIMGFMTNAYAGGVADETVNFSPPKDVSLAGHTILRSVASYSLADVEAWAYYDHEAIISVLINCAPGEGPSCEATAAAIVQTITYTG